MPLIDSRAARAASAVVVRVPAVRWLRTYRREYLGADLTAGVTVTALLIPSGLAYGSLAGLSPVSGLYTGALAMFGYALFAASRVQVVGPESQTAILVAAGLAPLAAAGSPEYAALAAAMALLAGLVCLIAAALRLGFLADYLSQPVLVGYLTGVALIVLVGQAAKLVGTGTSGETLVELVAGFADAFGDADLASAVTGGATLLVVIGLRHWWPRVPAPLVAVVAAIAVSAALDLESRGVAVVGPVQAGFAPLSVPDVALSDLLALLGPTLALVTVVFADTVLSARAYALRRGDPPVDGNQELLALGVANVGSGLFSGFAVGASDSRTAVSHSVGGRTQAVGLVAAGLTVAFLLLLTPLIAPLPSPTLAAVVLVAAWSLLRPQDFARLWRLRRFEFWLAVLALAGVAVLGILPGLLVAAVVNLLELVWRLSRPRISRLGPTTGGGRWRRVAPADAAGLPGLLVLRFGGPLFYGNAEFVLGRIRRELRRRGIRSRWAVFDCEAVTLTDTNGLLVFQQVASFAEGHGVRVGLARVDSALEAALREAGIWPHYEHLVFDRVADAVDAYDREHGTTGSQSPSTGEAGRPEGR